MPIAYSNIYCSLTVSNLDFLKTICMYPSYPYRIMYLASK